MALTVDLKKAEDRIQRAIVTMMEPYPFFSYLMMRLKPRKMPEMAPIWMRTMGVDVRGNLIYDEKFVESLTMDEVRGCVAHEVVHVALLHPLRGMTVRYKELANIAMDMVVNSIVQQQGLKLPKGSVYIDTMNDACTMQLLGAQVHIRQVSKKIWEDIYEELLQQLQQQGKNPEDLRRRVDYGWDNHFGEGTGEDGEEGEQLSDEERQEYQTKWREALAEAANYAKQQGKLPRGMDRLIDEILKPKVGWRSLLLKYLRQHMMPVDWSYHKPNKKSKSLGVFLPTTLKEQCEVEVIVDTSGSISQRDLTEFTSEIVGIAKSFSHVKMWVTFVDMAVQARYTIDSGSIPQILAMKPKGGGGTSMEVGLDHVKKTNANIPVAVVLTDGCDSFHRKARDYPFEVIWCIAENGITLEQAKSNIKYGVKIKLK